MENKRATSLLRGIVCFAFWLIVWYVLAAIVDRVLVLPTPTAVAKKMAELFGMKSFYASCLWTLWRIFVGLLTGLVSGVLLAAVCSASRILDTLFSPVIAIVKATPVASIIILMLYILGKSAVPIIATWLMVLPIVFAGVRRGIASVPTESNEVAKVYGFGFKKRLRYCILPAVLPYFSAACRSALGLAWKAGVAAEVICTPKNSIGVKLHNAKTYLESEELYAWTILVILLSFLIEKGVVYVLDRFAGKGGAARADVS